MPNPLTSVYGITTNIKTGFEILYRTTDALGDPQVTVTTLLIPNNASDNKLLSYQTFEDSGYENCAPSYGLQQGAVNSTITVELAIIAAGLY